MQLLLPQVLPQLFLISLSADSVLLHLLRIPVWLFLLPHELLHSFLLPRYGLLLLLQILPVSLQDLLQVSQCLRFPEVLLPAEVLSEVLLLPLLSAHLFPVCPEYPGFCSAFLPQNLLYPSDSEADRSVQISVRSVRLWNFSVLQAVSFLPV